MITDAIILAGGFGERLWPASKPTCPKQFLSLESGISFLQASILRAAFVNPNGKIVIITRKDLLELATSQCLQLTEQAAPHLSEKLKQDLYVIAEPAPKHTTAPIILACRFLEKLTPTQEHTSLVLTSDHVISPPETFSKDCKIALDYAQNDNFVCFAIKPTEPATGFGYIKEGNRFHQGKAFTVAGFKEKPDITTAMAYLSDGHYWWNSGMFAFKNTLFKQELKQCCPSVYAAFFPLKNAALPEITYFNGIKCVTDWNAMDAAYEVTPSISIDKAVAEQTKKACAIEAAFTWDDVGSWDAFEKLFKDNPGKTALVNSNNCFVYSDIPVAVCGVDDLVVVIKNGSALVMKKGSSPLVREAAQKMNSAENKP